MPKNSKRRARCVNLADFWDPEYVSQSSTPPLRSRLSRPPPPRPVVDPQALKRAFMLQHFQFILRSDLLSVRSTGGGTLPQGQRKLIECLHSSDSIVPWTAVHSVVMRTTLDQFECPICLDTPTAPRITECGHVFCMSCMLQYLHIQKQSDQPRTCPVCHSLVGLFMLRPVVLQPIHPLTIHASESAANQPVRFDLFRRERNSCILYRYDDPRMTATGRAPLSQHPHRSPGSGGGGGIEDEVCLPAYGEPSAVQCRYVISSTEFAANQRYLDGASISERLHEIELLERPLAGFDAADEHFLLEALNEVTKEPEALAPSLLKNSPSIAPKPTGAAAGAAPMAHRAPSQTMMTTATSTNTATVTLASLAESRQHPPPANAVFELYAEGGGQPFYLHMVNVKMLKYDAQLRGAALSDTVTGRVLDIVTFTQNEESRRIYKVFSHVPLHGTIQLCLLDLAHCVLPETLAMYKHTLDDMARRRQERRKADEAVSEGSVDASWQAYLHRYAPHSFDSPAILPSDISLETADDSAPFLQLPSAGSGWEDHGLPPNTLDTRQRATKRQEGGTDALAAAAAAGPAHTASEALASLATTTVLAVDAPPPSRQEVLTPTQSSANSCWGGGSAAKLFRGNWSGGSAAAGGGGGVAAVVSTWGGHVFEPTAAAATPTKDGKEKGREKGKPSTVHNSPKCQRQQQQQQQQQAHQSPQNRKANQR